MPGRRHIARECKNKIQADYKRRPINMVELDPRGRGRLVDMVPDPQILLHFQLIIQELCSGIQALPFTGEPTNNLR